MIRVYGMDYERVMQLPMKVFWELSGQVRRLLADEHKQLLELLVSSKSPEAAQEMHAELHRMSPEPVKVSAAALAQAQTLDKGGLDDLRSLA